MIEDYSVTPGRMGDAAVWENQVKSRRESGFNDNSQWNNLRSCVWFCFVGVFVGDGTVFEVEFGSVYIIGVMIR
jgi:hypothetical protein